MKFHEAMKLVEEGKKVRKTSWVCKDYYLYINENGLLVDSVDNGIKIKVKGEWEEYIVKE